MAEPTPTPEVTPTPSPTPAATPEAGGAPGSILDEALGKAKPEAEGTPEPAKEPEPAKAGAPEKYADFKLPEGVKLEGEKLTAATAIFKDLGLDQAGAQKLVDYHVSQMQEAQDGPAKLWQETQEVWMDELRSDPVLGKGMENGTVGASISKMLNTLPVAMSAAAREAFNYTGAGNHPAIVRAFYELSKKFSEPGHVSGNAPAQSKARPSAANALYPTLAKKE